MTSRYLEIHRVVLDYYRSLVPKEKKYFLAPFTIKKGANIYGLIFGTSHILGIDKFLHQCWKIDTQRGEANFDIDQDRISDDSPKLFPEMNIPKKLMIFEEQLTEEILQESLDTNKIIYQFTLLNGFLPKHAREIIKKLIKSQKLPKQKLNISYTSCKEDKPEQIVQYFK
jgi:hypothetical protein